MMFLKAAFLVAASAGSAMAGQFTGRGTTYGNTLTSPNGASGYNCGFTYLSSYSMKYYVAMNAIQYPGSCGKCIKVTCVSNCGATATTTTMMVVDQLPEQNYGALDMSPEAFSAVTGVAPGVSQVTWDWVDCNNGEVDGSGIQIQIKDGSNAFWIGILANNAGKPLQSVSIGGSALQGQLYNYWTGSYSQSSNMVLTLTAQDGETLTATLPQFGPGQLIAINKQFSGGPSPGPAPAPGPSPSPPAPAPTDTPTVAPTDGPSPQTTSPPVQSPTNGNPTTSVTPTTAASATTLPTTASTSSSHTGSAGTMAPTSSSAQPSSSMMTSTPTPQSNQNKGLGASSGSADPANLNGNSSSSSSHTLTITLVTLLGVAAIAVVAVVVVRYKKSKEEEDDYLENGYNYNSN